MTNGPEGSEVRCPTVVFESWRGKYSDNPRAVSERLAVVRPDVRRVWVVSGPDVKLPTGVERVVRNTPEYFLRISTADWFLCNDMMPRYPLKTRRVTYVQMWHGTPLKRIGFDVSNAFYRGAQAYARRLARDVARWDYLVSPNVYSTTIFKQAFRYSGPVLELGYPRNDVLSSSLAEPTRQRIRADLGLPASAKTVLYAPTWRDDDSGQRRQVGNPLLRNPESLLSRLPDDTVLLIRLHHLESMTPLSTRHPRVRDVSHAHDIRELYLASDVMVTDYSSTMFDFAVTGRPIIYYAYDLGRYRDELRGFYFDLEHEAPGPIVSTEADLAKELNDLEEVKLRYSAAYQVFRQRYCTYDDGHATDRFIHQMFA